MIMARLAPDLLATAIVRLWTCSYTAGVAPEVRDARRAEIESDLWEHQRDAARRERSAAETAAELMMRCAMGIPADLLWRLEQRGATRGRAAEEVGTMQTTTMAQRWALMVPGLMALFGLVSGVIYWPMTAASPDENTLVYTLGGPAASLAMGFVPALIAAVGILLAWRSPAVGTAATLAGIFLYVGGVMAFNSLGGVRAFMSLPFGWPYVVLSVLAMLGAAAYLVGLAAAHRAPALGSILAIVGAAPMAIVMWWTILMPIIALALGWFGVQRARRFAQAGATGQ